MDRYQYKRPKLQNPAILDAFFMKIAASAYPIESLSSLADLTVKLSEWVATASEHADVLVFPEYAGLEFALLNAPDGISAMDTCIQSQAMLPEYLDIHTKLARQHDCIILSGSLPVKTDEGWRNRAYLFGADGCIGHQDKLILTPWERTQTPLGVGTELSVFDTDVGRLGVLICYDSEFPLQARALHQSGMDVLLVPSCTDAATGLSRVQIASRARALETGVTTAMGSLVGAVPQCPFLDANCGQAGIYCAPDLGAPSDGILAETDRNTPGWVYAEVCKSDPTHPREVHIARHWPEQFTDAAKVTNKCAGQKWP
jgi:predicted amidohydrolase